MDEERVCYEEGEGGGVDVVMVKIMRAGSRCSGLAVNHRLRDQGINQSIWLMPLWARAAAAAGLRRQAWAGDAATGRNRARVFLLTRYPEFGDYSLRAFERRRGRRKSGRSTFPSPLFLFLSLPALLVYTLDPRPHSQALTYFQLTSVGT